MFKVIVIHMTEPLCDCGEGTHAWSVVRDAEGKNMLSLSCKTCDTELVVPHHKFRARFHFDKPVLSPNPEPKPKPKPKAKAPPPEPVPSPDPEAWLDDLIEDLS